MLSLKENFCKYHPINQIYLEVKFHLSSFFFWLITFQCVLQSSFKNRMYFFGCSNAKIVFPLDQTSQPEQKKGRETVAWSCRATTGLEPWWQHWDILKTTMLSNSSEQSTASSAANPQVIATLWTRYYLQRKNKANFQPCGFFFSPTVDRNWVCCSPGALGKAKLISLRVRGEAWPWPTSFGTKGFPDISRERVRPHSEKLLREVATSNIKIIVTSSQQ